MFLFTEALMPNSIKAQFHLAWLRTLATTVILGLNVHSSAAQGTLSVSREAAKPNAGTSQKLAPNMPGRQTAGSATCTPANSTICTGFAGGCDAVNGGLSSSSEGGVTCSVAVGKTRETMVQVNRMVLSARRSGKASIAEVSTCESDGTSDGIAICGGFGQSCARVGCGPSTNPDGTVSCACN